MSPIWKRLIFFSLTVLCFGVLLGGCNKDTDTDDEPSVFVKPQLVLPKVALVGVKYQFREAPDNTAPPISKAAIIMFDRLTDQLIYALEKNNSKMVMVNINDIYILPFYKNLGTGSNSGIEYVPPPYKFVDFRKFPVTARTLCNETGVDAVVTFQFTIEPIMDETETTQVIDYQFYAKATAVDASGKILIREDIPLNLKLSDFDQKKDLTALKKKIDKDEFTAKLIEKEGFNSQANRTLYQEQMQVLYSKFIVRFANTPLPKGNK